MPRAPLNSKSASIARRALAGAMLLALLPTPLRAQYGQYGPSQSVPDVPRAPDQERRAPPAAAAQAQVLRAASCLVGRDASAAAALLATEPYSAAERREAVRTLRSAERCLDGGARLATSPLLLRGALAESLFEAQFGRPPDARTPPAAIAPLLSAEAAAAHRDVAPAFALGECASARRGDLVQALIAADPASEAEGAAMQALNPVFGQCVAPGTSLAVDQASLRAILAESLYRWSVAQRGGSSSP